MPDQPITRTDLTEAVREILARQDRAVETIAREISRRADEANLQFRNLGQSIQLLGVTLEGIQSAVTVHTRILTQERTDTARLRADLDAALARIAALEARTH